MNASAWFWILVSFIILLVIAIIIVLVVMMARKCKKSFTKAFGDQYGGCLFDAAKKSLSAAHLKQVCQIVESCPDQLHACVATIKEIISQLKPPLPTAAPGIFDKVMAACPSLCITKYINLAAMSDSEKTQWQDEIQAFGQYVNQNCLLKK